MADVVKKPDPNPGGVSNSPSSHEMARFMNVDTAKLFALVFVIGFILYHGTMHLKSGGDSCVWLISDGRFQGYGRWQPYGCMMHKYSQKDAKTCMHSLAFWGKDNHIAFVGDSRIRELYYNFKSMFSNEERVNDPKLKWSDLKYIDPVLNLKIEFRWKPYVDAEMSNVYREWINSEIAARPNIVVTSSATWTIKEKNNTEEALADFQRKLSLLRRYYTQLHNTTKILWMMQEPVDESKLSKARSRITNKLIDSYNKAARDYLVDDHKGISFALLWSSSRLIAQGFRDETPDGLHLSTNILSLDTQTLLNMYCNDHMNFVDGTCCRNSESITHEQIGFGIAVLVCVVATFILYIYRRKFRRNGCGRPKSVENGHRSNGTGKPTGKPQKGCVDSCYELLFALTKFGLILGYCFLCDRTNFFMKENKNYSAMNFFLPLAYVMFFGFFFTEDIEQSPVLNRDQTDEWKGWMQLVILIYHQTGASKQIPIYMWVRCLVSAYLFMTGYGHFTFFWKKGEYKIYRLCQVLFRMNALVIGLCFAMNRPYQFYYFVPLVTFWFLVVYLTMAIWPHLTQKSADGNVFHYFYMLLKFIIVTVIISVFFASEVLFEKIFLTHPIKALFVTQDDSIHEWRFRWGLDRFSVVWGMVFAFGYLFMKKLKLFDDMTRKTIFSTPISWVVIILSIVGLGGYHTFVSLCANKPQCNNVHSYIAFIPITSFVLLRNIPGWLRTRYSSFFAWFGKISLELFIAQYHIWLAADTHGLLVLVPSYPVLNIIVTSFIFVCIAHELSKCTGIIANYAVPNDWKLLLRNSIVFFGILVPVGIRHGVFEF